MAAGLGQNHDHHDTYEDDTTTVNNDGERECARRRNIRWFLYSAARESWRWNRGIRFDVHEVYPRPLHL